MWGAWFERLVRVSSDEVLVVSERVACARCGEEYHRAELNETTEGKLCEVCLQDFLDEEADGWGVSVSQGVKHIGGFVVVVGICWLGYVGPRTYFDGAVERAERCIDRSLAGGGESSEQCLSELEGTGWVGYFPHMTDYRAEVGDLRLGAYGAKLYNQSAVNPSVAGRLEAMEKLVGVDGAERPVGHVLEGEPAHYLWTVESGVEARRASLAEGMYDGIESMAAIEDAYDLAVSIGDEALLDVVFERTQAVPLAECPVNCEHVLKIAASMCLRGGEADGKRLAEEFGEFSAGRTVDEAHTATWGQLAGDVQEQFRESFEKKQKAVGRRAELLRDVCGGGSKDSAGKNEGEGGENGGGMTDQWWKSEEAREVILDLRAPHTERVILGVMAQWLIREKLSREDLRRVIEQTHDGHPDFFAKPEPLVAFADAQVVAKKLMNTPGDILRHGSLGAPETWERAAERLETGDGADGGADEHDDSAGSARWRVMLRRAFLLEGAVAAAQVGDEEGAFAMVERAEASGVEGLRAFRASLYRVFGEPARAMETLAGTSEAMKPKMFVQWLRAAGAAGAFDEAVSRLEGLGRLGRNDILRSAYRSEFLGLTYAVAYYGEVDFEETVRAVLPEGYHPKAVEESRPDERPEGQLKQIYAMITGDGERRGELRHEIGYGIITHPVWYVAALARSVGASHDPSVWVDFLMAGSGEDDSIAAWRRAEVGRWRGDGKAEKKWMERVFVDEERRESSADVVLELMR